jgi:thioredoxin reductase (NADPH)
MNKAVILVVDDDAQVRAAVRRDLRSRYDANYSVIAAGSGEEGLTAIRELKTRGSDLAILLSDQRMPGMLGVELLSSARTIYPFARRVLLTAYSDIDAAVRAINDAQADYYLSKPWHPPEERLFPVLDDLLDAWQAERPLEAAGLRLVGRQWSPQSHAIKNFLGGNLIPYRWLDVDREPQVGELLTSAEIGEGDLPALVFEDGSTLRRPSLMDLASRLGLRVAAGHDLYDLVIVGAGPAGLAAAVYGSSEGLRTLLVDRHSPGGQAGTSSCIENYLGFPTGVSGTELARRAIVQAQRLGTEFLAPVEANSVALDGGYKRVNLQGNREIVARAMIVTTGMTYRELPARGVAERTGAGVYYGARAAEAPACRERRVIVVGGGNSAGQCALHLARYAKEVQIVVRRDGLRETMSHYLIDQIAATQNIHVQPQTMVEAVEGTERMERVVLRSMDTGALWVEDVEAMFILIGTKPHSEWLPEAVLRDAKGFVLTGRDSSICERFTRLWKEPRQPFLLETTVPGIFAAGDVRAGAVNRVAAAVGEGAMAVRLVNEYLSLT